VSRVTRDSAKHDAQNDQEWFDLPNPDTGEVGLRFGCTQCGNCCSGPPGVVLVNDQEIDALASRLSMDRQRFIEQHTHETGRGRSLNEHRTEHGMDCIFLDRAKVPGRAVCSVYEDRPSQCRAWPFWRDLTRTRRTWVKASANCPGLDQGRLYSPEEIRITRAKDPL
jgi:uncharacterized protein